MSYCKAMTVFDRPQSVTLNEARLNHLASLGLPIDGKFVLEVGAGIGLLTAFFEERYCFVFSCDGRKENCAEHLRRFPNRTVFQFDLLKDDYSRLPHADVCFCYGVLYHLHDPAMVIENLSRITWEMFLVESCFFHEDDGKLHPFDENSRIADQSLDGYACRPSRNWMWDELAKHSKHVYCPKTQPNHYEYPLRWPVHSRSNARAVFIASHSSLDLPTLSEELLTEYEGNPL